MENQDDKKLKLFGLLAADPLFDIRTLVQEFGVSIHRLKRWEKEYNRRETIADLDKVLDVDEVIVKRVAEEVAAEIVELEVVPENLEIDEQTNEIVTSSELAKRREQAELDAKNFADSKIAKFIGGIQGLQVLKESTQDAANKAMAIIAIKMQDPDVQSKDFKELVASLTAIQNAFFNRPTTTVNVKNSNTLDGGGTLSDFRNKLKG